MKSIAIFRLDSSIVVSCQSHNSQFSQFWRTNKGGKLIFVWIMGMSVIPLNYLSPKNRVFLDFELWIQNESFSKGTVALKWFWSWANCALTPQQMQYDRQLLHWSNHASLQPWLNLHVEYLIWATMLMENTSESKVKYGLFQASTTIINIALTDRER